MLSDYLSIPIQRINEIVNGKRGITVSTAWLLSEAFQTTPEFWMNLQIQHELSKNRPKKSIKPIEQVLKE
jgi:addiction module HigA family antidote